MRSDIAGRAALAAFAAAVAATGGVETTRDVASAPLAERGRALVASADERRSAALREYAALLPTLEQNLRADTTVVLYADRRGGDADNALLKDAHRIHFQLRTLLFPRRIQLAFSGVPDAARRLTSAPYDLLVVSLTPGRPVPGREVLEALVRRPEFALFRAIRSGP